MKRLEAVIGRKVRAAREALGQSQLALSKALGASRPAANQIEHGTHAIGVERLCQLALALGVEPADLLPRLGDLPGLFGMAQVSPLDPIAFPKGQAWLDAVEAGARQYVAEHGQRPRTDGADASEYVGFDTTWCAINAALPRGSHADQLFGGLHDFLDDRGIGRRRSRGRP